MNNNTMQLKVLCKRAHFHRINGYWPRAWEFSGGYNPPLWERLYFEGGNP